MWVRLSIDPVDRDPLGLNRHLVECLLKGANRLIDIIVDDCQVKVMFVGFLEKSALVDKSLETRILLAPQQTHIRAFTYTIHKKRGSGSYRSVQLVCCFQSSARKDHNETCFLWTTGRSQWRQSLWKCKGSSLHVLADPAKHDVKFMDLRWTQILIFAVLINFNIRRKFQPFMLRLNHPTTRQAGGNKIFKKVFFKVFKKWLEIGNSVEV